ncbi:hypothetical protein Y032_0044g947 [Ancylostoma ceylanicum]|uniref:Uncharacterized protein n=1 Tax=Ancylostoma ceylanicum TaxID=53326 RepID=A0A016UDG0_9BILA|nr:hypothetical protein Y032_0044g947 [Ancylostoma ceylanicum]
MMLLPIIVERFLSIGSHVTVTHVPRFERLLLIRLVVAHEGIKYEVSVRIDIRNRKYCICTWSTRTNLELVLDSWTWKVSSYKRTAAERDLNHVVKRNDRRRDKKIRKDRNRMQERE